MNGSGGGRGQLGSLPPSAPRPGAARTSKAPGRSTFRTTPERMRGVATRTAPTSLRLPLHRFSDAYLALAVFALLEIDGIGLASLKQFTGPFELTLATRALLPLALTIAAPVALASGGVAEILARGERRAGRIAAAVLAGAFAAAVTYGVGSGRHLVAIRIPVAAILGLAFAGVAFAIAPLVSRAIGKLGGARGLVWAIGLVAFAALVDALGTRIFPRLYPAFHFGVTAIAILIAAIGSIGLGAFDAKRTELFGLRLLTPAVFRAALALVLFAGGAAFASDAAKRLARFDNVRLVYTGRAPAISQAIAFAARIAPPPKVDDAPIEAKTSGHAVDFSGRDIVLISIDALRADHVGAYGYARPTTPNLDALAKEGVVFDAAYSPTPHTSYAVTSLMTGKYMRPLVLQGLGADSETLAAHLRRYGYKTAAFFPPAVFFIDEDRFARFRDSGLDFEYRRVEFMPAEGRAKQVASYLDGLAADQRALVWVHLFEPHEPYEAHPDHDFGERDLDRYDGEIAASDDAIGAIVKEVRTRRPKAIVIVTADHGEEFGEHGGRYHGTTVFEEQVRVPLIVNAPGLLSPHRIDKPVQLVDIVPTLLAGLDIPRPARVRGTDLGPMLANTVDEKEQGFAFAETDADTLLAKGSLRLICARAIGACALYDVQRDPGERVDIASSRPTEVQALRAELHAIESSHGRYEKEGLRAEGTGWPPALRRGIAGDGDAAEDVAALLDDADAIIRRKAAEVLFELARKETGPALRLALVRDEDDTVKRFAALGLTRIGEGAPRTRDLLQDPDVGWRRLAALALAEAGDDSGKETLIAWWRHAFSPEKDVDRIIIPFERAKQVAAALGRIRSKAALPPLIDSLDDIRLRPYVARALAQIGEEAARPSLAEKLSEERYQTTRVELAKALVKLKGGPELRAPLIRWLGVPDPMPGGVKVALDAKILDLVGGPRERDLRRLREFARSGVAAAVVVPPGAPGKGVRVICRAKTTDGAVGEVRVGLRNGPAPAKSDHDSLVPKDAPDIDPRTSVTLQIAAGEAQEPFATLPAASKIKPGSYGDFVFYATQNVKLEACVVVPLADELPPPPREPWSSSSDAN